MRKPLMRKKRSTPSGPASETPSSGRGVLWCHTTGTMAEAPEAVEGGEARARLVAALELAEIGHGGNVHERAAADFSWSDRTQRLHAPLCQGRDVAVRRRASSRGSG